MDVLSFGVRVTYAFRTFCTTPSADGNALFAGVRDFTGHYRGLRKGDSAAVSR